MFYKHAGAIAIPEWLCSVTDTLKPPRPTRRMDLERIGARYRHPEIAIKRSNPILKRRERLE